MKANVSKHKANKKEEDLKKKVLKKTAPKVSVKKVKEKTVKSVKKTAKGRAVSKIVKSVNKVPPIKKAVPVKKPVKAAPKAEAAVKPLKKTKIQKAAKPAAGRKKTAPKLSAVTAAKKTAQKSPKKTAPAKAKKAVATVKVIKKKVEKKPAVLKTRTVTKPEKKAGVKTAGKAVIKKEISAVKPGKITARIKDTSSKAPKKIAKKPVVKSAIVLEEKKKKGPGVKPVVRLKRAVVKKTAEAVGKSVPELLSVAEIEAKEAKTRPLKIFLPVNDIPEEAEKSYADVRPAGLPEEYGENSLLLMVVDPNNIYLTWELTGTDVPADRRTITIRVYDVTGKDHDATDFHSFLEIRSDRRTGSGFYEIMMPGREVIAEIGLVDSKGAFTCILRSSRVSLPPLLKFDEFGIVQKLIEAGIPIGY